MIKKNLGFFISIIFTTIILIFLGFTYIADVNALNHTEIIIDDISIQELKLTYCKLRLSIVINNPNDRAVSIKSVKFNIIISNNSVGYGNFSKVFIPSNSIKKKNATITINYSDVANAVVDSIKMRNFHIIIQGELKINVLFDLITISHEFVDSHYY